MNSLNLYGRFEPRCYHSSPSQRGRRSFNWNVSCTAMQHSNARGNPLLTDLSLTRVAVLPATHWDKLSIKCALNEDKCCLTEAAFRSGQSLAWTDAVYRRFTRLFIQFFCSAHVQIRGFVKRIVAQKKVHTRGVNLHDLHLFDISCKWA